MKKLVLLLTIFMFSCSGEDVPDEVNLYDLQIVTEIETTVYNYVGGVESIDKRKYEKSFYMLTAAQVADVKKQYPAGSTVTDDNGLQFRTVRKRTVSHILSIHK